MNESEYLATKQRLLAAAEAIERAKRPGYTLAHTDVLHNFKSVAQRMGITPMQAWGVYFLKHVDALVALAKNPAIPQAEPVHGRFCDLINYAILGFALYVENEPDKDPDNSTTFSVPVPTWAEHEFRISQKGG